MSHYVTLAQAKTHLGIPQATTSEDAVIQECLDAAEAYILLYLGLTTATPTTSPVIQRAMLEQCAEFRRFRGDDQEGQGAPRPERDGEPSPFIKRLLTNLRKPTTV